MISLLQDLYIYVSEQKEFGDFNNSDSLVWTKKDLQYGDWYSGENSDGIYSFSTQFPASEVYVGIMLSLNTGKVFVFRSMSRTTARSTCTRSS